MSKDLTQILLESSPPDPKIEKWILDNKATFKKEYGDNWEQYLYGKAWSLYKSEDVNTDLDRSETEVQKTMDKQKQERADTRTQQGKELIDAKKKDFDKKIKDQQKKADELEREREIKKQNKSKYQYDYI